MTFGEHLDELRQTLITAILSLLVGVIVGLFFARAVVQYVQLPLKEALRDHYAQAAAKEYRNYLVEQAEKGGAVPDDIDSAAALFAEQRLVTEDHYVDP